MEKIFQNADRNALEKLIMAYRIYSKYTEEVGKTGMDFEKVTEPEKLYDAQRFAKEAFELDSSLNPAAIKCVMIQLAIQSLQERRLIELQYYDRCDENVSDEIKEVYVVIGHELIEEFMNEDMDYTEKNEDVDEL